MEKIKRQAEKRQQELKKKIADNIDGLSWFTSGQENGLILSDYIEWAEKLTTELKELKALEKTLRIIKQKEEGAGKNEIN